MCRSKLFIFKNLVKLLLYELLVKYGTNFRFGYVSEQKRSQQQNKKKLTTEVTKIKTNIKHVIEENKADEHRRIDKKETFLFWFDLE